MEWMITFGTIAQSVFVGAAIFIALGIAANWLDALKKQVKIKEMESNLFLLEDQVATFIRAAEQKFNTVADIAEDFMTPEQKEKFDEHRRKANADKKAYVLSLIKQTFPDLDIKYVDAIIEGAYNTYKSSKERAQQEVE
jgi:hypothetical protein